MGESKPCSNLPQSRFTSSERLSARPGGVAQGVLAGQTNYILNSTKRAPGILSVSLRALS